ncbi:MAG: hypothetical protein IPJ18_00125 [Betaproteobacteria bacterium]|nr:hypothetical protein [Betaproteobacteria bacterium]
MLPQLNALRQHWQLPPVPHFFTHIYQDADHTLCLFPPWFCPPLTGWPNKLTQGDFQRFDPHPTAMLAPQLAEFLNAGAAPVVFTPGSAHRHAAVYFQRALQAVRRLGCRAIFLTAHPDHVPPELPPTVLWQSYVPLRDTAKGRRPRAPRWHWYHGRGFGCRDASTGLATGFLTSSTTPGACTRWARAISFKPLCCGLQLV